MAQQASQKVQRCGGYKMSKPVKLEVIDMIRKQKEILSNIKTQKRNKAIRLFIELSHTIKELEYSGCQWFLKLFGIYKLQNWLDKKIKKGRETLHEQ